MTVSGVTSLYDSGLNYSSENTDALGKNEFLELLITQMRYQDPLDPVDNSQMIAQLAQFSSLEQMTNLSNSQMGLQSYSLIGKEIFAEQIDMEGQQEAIPVQGKVKSVTKSGDTFLLEVETQAEGSGVVGKTDFSAYTGATTYTSEEVYEDLVSRGYLNTEGKVTEKFNAEESMILDSNYMALEPAIRYILNQTSLADGVKICVNVRIEDVVKVNESTE